jgi:hypothetical protein
VSGSRRQPSLAGPRQGAWTDARARAPLARGRRRALGPGVAPLAGGLGLLGLVGLAIAIVLIVAERSSFLTPSVMGGPLPRWYGGPLEGLLPSLTTDRKTLQITVSSLIGAMYVCYLLALRYAPRLDARWTLAALFALQVVFLLSPPLFSTDIFSYLNYGRMAAVHHLNPYVVVPAAEPHSDPAFQLINWFHLKSPYGPLFTLFTEALAPLGVATSFWVMKVVVALGNVAVLSLVWRCAIRLGRDPLTAIVFVGLNPLVLLWVVGAVHNDGLMMLFVLLAVLFTLRAGPRARSAQGRRVPTRDSAKFAAAAGASLAVAVAIKAPAALLLPIFLLVGRWRDFLAGVLGAGVILAAASFAAFGTHLPILGAQHDLVIPQGLTNLIGMGLGLGGETRGLHAAFTAALVVVVVLCCAAVALDRERWVGAAGVAMLALVLTLSWAEAWYILWILPFAALARSRVLRSCVLLLGVLLILEYMPAVGPLELWINLNPTATPVGHNDQLAIERLLN